MIEFEKRGVPTVMFTSAEFVRDAQRSGENFGLPQLAKVVVPEPFTNHSADAVRKLVDAAIDQVVAGLIEPLRDRAQLVQDLVFLDEDWLDFSGPDQLSALEQMQSQFLVYGWSDGFPLLPPTKRAMDRMLSGTRRDPQEVVAVLEPGFGIATVQKIAANAVMAGCLPEHLPVVIASIECLAEPQIYLRNKAMSTGPAAPLLVVNGPIRKKLNLNSACCALGPGAPSAANTVIGRAVRLCMMNVGHTYPGISDMDTVGTPLKYSMCVAENEEASPWTPFHVERGYEASASTVTVHFVYGICELKTFQSHDPEELIEIFSSAAMNDAQVSTGYWLLGRRSDPRSGTSEQERHMMLICPEHAEIFRSAGWQKADIRKAMHRRSRLPFKRLMLTKEREAMALSHPELHWLWDSPDTLLPVLEDADCYEIAVVGGTLGRGSFFWGSGAPVTKPIRE